MTDRTDRRRIYNEREERLISQGRPEEAKSSWQRRWIAAGKPQSMVRKPR